MSRFLIGLIFLFFSLLFVGCKTGNLNEETVKNSDQSISKKKTGVDEGNNSDGARNGNEKAGGLHSLEKSPPSHGHAVTVGAEITFSIDSHSQKHPISAYIYGLNHPKWEGRPQGLGFVRNGGNRHSAYNWENNASHAGSDWHNQNDDMLGNPHVPGENEVGFIKEAFSHGAAALVTVPMLGYVAADTTPKGDVNQTPDYLHKRFYVSKAKKGAPFSMTPNLNDNFVYQDEFVHFLEKMFPDARSKPATELFYSLDNEPGLWASTHPRLRDDATGDLGDPVTYSELMKKTIEYASAIKDVAPNAKIFGPVLYGYTAFENLQDAPDALGRDFIEFYLQKLQKYEAKNGRRLVDVLDVHWYPEVKVPSVGKKITSTTAFPELVKERIQAPRSLWDKDYTENSWITKRVLYEPIALLPRLQQKIDEYYPGTRIAVTEYYYGGGNDISGAIAQADVLGILGRENVFAASLWKMGNKGQDFVWGAFEIFRSYDYKGSKFGDISIEAKNSDIGNSSIYAALDSTNPERMTIILINKAETASLARTSIVHDILFRKADVYQLTSKDSNPRKAESFDIAKSNSFDYVMPARSVSLLELGK